MKSSLLGSVALVVLTLPAVAQSRSCRGEPTEIAFSFSGDASRTKVECSGGLVGGADCVADRIADGGAAAGPGTTYRIRVTPAVETQPDGSMRVRLELDEPEFRSDPGLPAETRNRAIRERRQLEAKLKAFETTLPGGDGDNAAVTPDRSGPGKVDAAVPFELMLLRPPDPRQDATADARESLSMIRDLLHRKSGMAGELVALADTGEVTASEGADEGTVISIPLADSGLLMPVSRARLALCDPDDPGNASDDEGWFEAVEGENPGEWTLVWRMPDGSLAQSAAFDLSDPQSGIEGVLEANPDGDARRTTLWPDGTLVTEREWPDGESELTMRAPDGRIDHFVHEADGTTSHHIYSRDGTLVTERRDAEGRLLESVTQRPDGWRERVDGSGNRTSSFTDENGMSVVETDRSGNTAVARFDEAGNPIEMERHQILPAEPGRDYFEGQLGGTDWDQLPDHLKRRYAESERAIEEKLLNRAREEAQAARDLHEATARAAEDTALSQETERKLAAIAREQEEADRRAAERQAQWDRRQAIDEAAAKARDLQKQYDEAAERGDHDAMQRIVAEQDAHHERAHDLLTPTPEEAREIEARDSLRQRLASEISARSSAIADMETASDSLQDAKEAFARPAGLISAGAEMQAATAGSTRLANRELYEARARQEIIRKRLDDPATPQAEREVLTDMLEVSRVKEEGAIRQLTDNARLTAAGYTLDGALTATGAKLVTVAGRAAGGIATRAAATAPGRAMTAAATTGAEAATSQGLAALRTVGLDEVARAAAHKASGLADSAGRALATDISTPVMTRLGSAADNAARKLVGDEAADAAGGILGKAADIAGTDVGELPGKLRKTFDEAALRRGVSVPEPAMPAMPTTRDPYIPANAGPRSPTPEGPFDIDNSPRADQRQGTYSREEISQLHEPGRNLTGDEASRKHHLYEAREKARNAVDDTTINVPPPFPGSGYGDLLDAYGSTVDFPPPGSSIASPPPAPVATAPTLPDLPPVLRSAEAAAWRKFDQGDLRGGERIMKQLRQVDSFYKDLTPSQRKVAEEAARRMYRMDVPYFDAHKYAGFHAGRTAGADILPSGDWIAAGPADPVTLAAEGLANFRRRAVSVGEFARVNGITPDEAFGIFNRISHRVGQDFSQPGGVPEPFVAPDPIYGLE